jgi:hypothetical protein
MTIQSPTSEAGDSWAPTLAADTERARNAPLTSSRPLPALHYGNARLPMIEIVPDDHWPSMWRMVGPSGQLSDMTNLSRIKDAAATICERGPPARNRLRFHWRQANG